MKKILLVLLLGYSHQLAAQTQQNTTPCIITSVKGVAAYNGKNVKPGDAVPMHHIEKQLLLQTGTVVTFFSTKGSFKVVSTNVTIADKAPQPAHASNHNILHFAKEILRLNGRSVNLSSRGDCACVLAEECLSTDPAINDKLLFIDTLTFPVHPGLAADSFFYFIQFKTDKGIYNNKLPVQGGNVVLTLNDLRSDGQQYFNTDSGSVSLGLFRYVQGQKKPSLVTSLKLSVVPKTDLIAYYKVLKQHMPEASEQQAFAQFYEDLYVYYGKPNPCYLRRLVAQH